MSRFRVETQVLGHAVIPKAREQLTKDGHPDVSKSPFTSVRRQLPGRKRSRSYEKVYLCDR